MRTNSASPDQLSSGAATAMYVGALLGPSVLLLPGLAVRIAGPASILAWLVLLVLSAVLCRLFTRLGVRFPTGGTAGYAAAGLGPLAGRAAGWCFVAGAVLGAPVVCLIGGSYLAALFDGGRLDAVLAAGVLLAAVVLVSAVGARVGTSVQLWLVAALIVVTVLAVAGSVPHGRWANWAPFAARGWPSVGHAAATVMLGFVGWEAIAPLTGRLAAPGRQLPRITGAAFTITSVVYLGLAVATISVLGAAAGPAPLAGLLRAAVGPVGPLLAAMVAVALTLAATNAYLAGAVVTAAHLRASVRPRAALARRPSSGTWAVQVGIAGVGAVLLAGVGFGVLDLADLVALPTALFLTVYLTCTAAAVRLFSGPLRLAAVGCTGAVLALLALSGYALMAPVAVITPLLAAATHRRTRRRHRPAPPPTGHPVIAAQPRPTNR